MEPLYETIVRAAMVGVAIVRAAMVGVAIALAAPARRARRLPRPWAGGRWPAPRSPWVGLGSGLGLGLGSGSVVSGKGQGYAVAFALLFRGVAPQLVVLIIHPEEHGLFAVEEVAQRLLRVGGKLLE